MYGHYDKDDMSYEHGGWEYFCPTCNEIHGPFDSSRKIMNPCPKETFERLRDLEQEVEDLKATVEMLASCMTDEQQENFKRLH